MLDTLFHQVVLVQWTRESRLIDWTLGGTQYCRLRLLDIFALAVHRGQRIVAVWRSHVYQHPFRSHHTTTMRPGREDDVRQFLDDPLESGIGIGRALPNVIGLRSQIY